MRDTILIINAGSSSIKFSVFAVEGGPQVVVRGQIRSLDGAPAFEATDASGRALAFNEWHAGRLSHADAVEHLLNWIAEETSSTCRPIGAGHRVVHGGTRFAGPVRLDASVVGFLESIIPLAPLHQPPSLAAIAVVSRLAPHLPQVACFDSAFHHAQSPLEKMYAIPRRYTSAGVRRYGFHGLSYEYVAGALATLDTGAAQGRTIVAHLGNGASMCAMQAGRSVATTMGFTPIDGLVMGTRCGAIDPGVVMHLQREGGLSVDDVQDLLYHQSGLLGVSGLSSDMRTLLESDDPHAREAVDLFVYRASREIGSLAAALGGLDALVFTGGIGEKAPAIRASICAVSRWLGVELDETANARDGPCISRPGSAVSAWVIKTNEELMIARHTLAVLSA